MSHGYPGLFVSPLAALCALAAGADAQSFCDFAPTTRETILNTDFTQIQTSCGPINVVGGIFQLRSVNIPRGVVVRGVGSRPMIWIVTGDFVVDGELTVRGADGQRVDTLNSAMFPTPGGIGPCGGGNGGLGSQNTTRRTFAAQAGFGPGQVPGLGGVGGQLGCSPATGSGGGGGTFATAGDPYYAFKASGTSLVQQLGIGGYGGPGPSGSPGRTLRGGGPGVSPFRDGRDDNNFFGLAFDLYRGMVVEGELPFPIGGQGGGGGGDRAFARCDGGGTIWINDPKGGGGGAGGGALIVVALGRIHIGANGSINADGGNGGGGEQAGSNNQGAGGGGGSGGSVVLYSPTAIELEVHGETYGNGDHRFAVSADGGVSLVGSFGGNPFNAKYPPQPAAVVDGSASGGFGGLGVVQLFTTPGANQDGTNTVLDDNVRVLRNGVPLTGAEKQRYLAWRGFPNGMGIDVDDRGVPTNIGGAEGDIRPSPVLLPVIR